MSVNGLQAQTYLCEGRDHDRVTTKLDKAKLSIQITGPSRPVALPVSGDG